jgi:hypothetical protein
MAHGKMLLLLRRVGYKPCFENVSSEGNSMKADSTTEQIIQNAIDEDPDIRLVLEIAARALDAESKEPPLHTGMATDTVVQPANLQSPVPPGTLC